MALNWFKFGDFVQAKEWFQKIRDNRGEIRTDLQNMSRIILLCCYYETQDWELIQALIREMKRWSGKRLFRFETRMFQFFSKAPFPAAEQKKEFQALITDLTELFKDRFENRVNLYFDPIKWAQSH